MLKALVVVVWLHAFGMAATISNEKPTQPRVDLYKKITQDIGVSLKDAFLAAEGDKDKGKKLLAMVQQAEINDLLGQFKKFVEIEFDKCIKKNAVESVCREQESSGLDQVKYISELWNSAQTTSAESEKKRLYLALVLLNFKVLHQVFKMEYTNFIESCAKSQKMNSDLCKQKMLESGHLADIARDLAVYLHGQFDLNTKSDINLKSLRVRISLYEKI